MIEPRASRAPLYPLASVDNALRILAMLSAGAPLRLIDVAAELEIAPSTAHRLLAMIEHHGFAERRTGTRSYAPGPTFARVARGVLREADLATVARPVLDRLAHEHRETVFVAVLDETGSRFIAGSESERLLRVGGLVGQHFPADETASGRVLLAALPPAARRSRASDERLGAITAELERIRRDGHAITVDTHVTGVSAIAVPIARRDEACLAALTFVTPTARYTRADLAALLPALRRAATRIAREWGSADQRAPV